MEDLNEISRQARVKVLELIYKAQTSHIGSNFSCIDILTALFSKIDLNKDVFVLSAGWKAAALYYFLHRAGRISEAQLDSYCGKCHACGGEPIKLDKNNPHYRENGEMDIEAIRGAKFCDAGCNGGDSKFIGLAEPIIPEIKIAGGSMGLGFPGAVGIALAKKMKGEEGKVYVLMSDGELQCGTTWESALIAAHHKLDNLVLIIDNNGLQAMGRTKDIVDMPYLDEMFSTMDWFTSFGFGHSFQYLTEALATDTTRPHVIIANTIKGRGVSFMQDNNLYHYKAPSEEEYNLALAELS